MNLNESAPLSRRLSHKFNSGWSHLDMWEDIGTVSVLSQRERISDYDSVHRTMAVQFAPEVEGVPVEDIKDALYDFFQRGCRCEHDCCGHYQSSLSRCLHLGAGRFAVLVNSYRNV